LSAEARASAFILVLAIQMHLIDAAVTRHAASSVR
jgi:hypothetical protein